MVYHVYYVYHDFVYFVYFIGALHTFFLKKFVLFSQMQI